MNEEPVGTFEWLVTFVLLAIPGLNLILLVYWAFSSGTKRSKQTYARSFLIAIPLAILAVGLLSGGLNQSFHEIRSRSIEQSLGRIQEAENAHLAGDRNVFRTFTATDGRTMAAMITGFEGSDVIIRRDDGQIITTSTRYFSKEDVDYIDTIRRKFESQNSNKSE